MTIINLLGFVRALGGNRPVQKGKVVATYWAGAGPKHKVDGANVIFSAPIEINLVNGVPDHTLELESTGVQSCVRLEVTVTEPKQFRRTLPTRFVSIPDVPEIDFEDLDDVDPYTFESSPESIAGWASVVGELTAIRTETLQTASLIISRSEEAKQAAKDATQAAKDASLIITHMPDIDVWAIQRGLRE